MTEEMALLIGTPTVTGTKIGKYGEVRVQADDGPGGNGYGISVHYIIADIDDAPPAVREKLLVAVVEGAYPQWLDDTPGGDMVDITYEADSANNSDRVLRMESVPTGDAVRLMFSTWERGGSMATRQKQDVILTQGQVANLITTLLALYPRLHED